jgi:hypothetical protein
VTPAPLPSRPSRTHTAGSRHPSPARRRAAKLVFVGALLVHGVLLVRAEADPHKLFGFRPFNESDSWRAEIVRVHADGSRIPVDDGTWAYDWDELASTPKLRNLGRLRHASAGAPASVDFLDRALDWAVDNIPDDPDTVALEARVTVFHNTRGPETIVLRSPRTTE